MKARQIFSLTEESAIVQYLDARKIQENRGIKEINYVTDITAKTKCPDKPNARGKIDKLIVTLKKKKKRQKSRISMKK